MATRATTGRFANLPIATKAFVLATVPTVATLVLVALATLWTTYVVAQRNLAADLDAESAIIAESISAPVAFGDRALAIQAVNTLRNHPRIDAVCVYDETRQLFASYAKPGQDCPASQPAPGDVTFPRIQRPVLVGARERGEVLIAGNFGNLYAYMRAQSLVMLTALLAGFGIAVVLTRRLRSAISGPVTALEQTANGIATSGDYSLRATSTTDDEIGRLGRSFNTMLDVIEHTDANRRRAEGALRTSEARWRAIIECATDAIVVIDRRGRIEAFNPAAERLFGYQEHELLDANVSRLMPAPYNHEHDGYLARYVDTSVPRIIGIGRDVTGLRKDGSTFPLRLSVGEMTMDGDRKFVGILHDLTERVRMETRLRDQAALTKIGEMAAVLAHEVKNPIAGVRGAIQVIGSRLPPGGKDALIVKEIVMRLDTLNDLMQDLLLFARPRELRPAAVDLRSLVQDVADLTLQDPLHEHLHIDIRGSAPSIQADAELLKIAIQNLVLNSAHAMGGRGHIDVALQSAGGVCEITIADSGPGIPQEVRMKLFTPFFTTKARGTGLGLATARRFVEAHSGTLTVDCPPGGGTTMTIQLPAHAS